MSEPTPRNNLEKIMETIWVNENSHNTWKDLIWNDYPLSDRDAEKIYARLAKTARVIMTDFNFPEV